MKNSKSCSKIILLLIGFTFTLSIGCYLGKIFSKTQESHYGVVIDQGPKLEEMQYAVDEILNAYNNEDLIGIGNTYAKDAVFMPPKLPSIHGRSEVINFFKEEVISNTSHLKIKETVQELIYFENLAVLRGLGKISIIISDSTSTKFPFKWTMLSEKNSEGKWEPVWDIYNDINQ